MRPFTLSLTLRSYSCTVSRCSLRFVGLELQAASRASRCALFMSAQENQLRQLTHTWYLSETKGNVLFLAAGPLVYGFARDLSRPQNLHALSAKSSAIATQAAHVHAEERKGVEHRSQLRFQTKIHTLELRNMRCISTVVIPNAMVCVALYSIHNVHVHAMHGVCVRCTADMGMDTCESSCRRFGSLLCHARWSIHARSHLTVCCLCGRCLPDANQHATTDSVGS